MAYSVKEVSILTGTTIRTLRYYDEIGLLQIGRNESNHRIYYPMDIMKLTMIASLKNLGLPLSKIKKIMDKEASDLDSMLRFQQKVIDKKIELLLAQRENTQQILEDIQNEKTLEEILLSRHLNLEKVNIQHVIDFTKYEEVDFEHYFQQIYHDKNNWPQSQKIMVEFIQYLNQLYADYFTKEHLVELIDRYKSEEAKLYFKKYGEDFHLFLVDLLLSVIDKEGEDTE
jgi:DNA-binding transcriptional MerR regulator